MNYFYISPETYNITCREKTNVKVVIVGMSPGRTQTFGTKKNPYNHENGSKVNNMKMAFSGSLRKRLVDMLNAIGLKEYLNTFLDAKHQIYTCEQLWQEEWFDIVQHISVLPQPVLETDHVVTENPVSLIKAKDMVNNKQAFFISKIQYKTIQNNNETLGENFNIFKQYFLHCDKNAIFIALGPSVEEVLYKLKAKDNNKMIIAIPHPSGNNKKRIDLGFFGKDSDIEGLDESFRRAHDYRKKADELIASLLSKKDKS